ncbi:MAG: carbohydrate kinase [Pseudomonas sp.]
MYLVCGEALFDFFTGAAGARSSELDYKAVAGGSPFNVAVGLRRLGVEAGLFGGLSTDFLGARLRRVLEEEGVRSDFLISSEAPTTMAMVALDANGHPHYSFRGEGCADRALGSEHLPLLGSDVRGLHVGSFSLVVQPIGDTLLELVRRESGKRLISLDPNVRLNPQPDADLWRSRVEELAQLADLIKVSDEDLQLLYPDTAPEQIIERWLGGRCQLVVMTRGAQGATAFSRQHGEVSVPSRQVQVRDTVGAGDTFQAALLAWLTRAELDSPEGIARLSREQLDSLLSYAVAAAAITCSRTGPDLPRQHEVVVS